MSYIIRSADELKDPFLCYCIFRRFIEEAGEDYIDCNESIVNPVPFILWLRGRGEITNEQLEKFVLILNEVYLQRVLQDEILFPNTYGESILSEIKVYTLLSEYMCQISEFRQRVWDSVHNGAFGFTDYKFYTNEDDISLACIIDDNDMLSRDICCEDIMNMNTSEINKLSYREEFNVGKNMTIEQSDCDCKCE